MVDSLCNYSLSDYFSVVDFLYTRADTELCKHWVSSENLGKITANTKKACLVLGVRRLRHSGEERSSYTTVPYTLRIKMLTLMRGVIWTTLCFTWRITEWGFDPFHGLNRHLWIKVFNQIQKKILKASLASYKPVPFRVSYLTAYWCEGLLRHLIMTGYLEFCWERHYAFMILIKGSRKLLVVKIGTIFQGPVKCNIRVKT